MISPQHHIKTTTGLPDEAQLATIIQIDTNGLTILRTADGRAVELQYFRIEAAERDQYLQDVQEILSAQARTRVQTILYNGPETTLVPDELYSEEITNDMTALLHGDIAAGKLSSDHVVNWQLHNLYRMDTAIHELITRNYPKAVTLHLVSRWLGCMQQEQRKERIELIIHPAHFLVALIKEEKLQLVQRFVYEADEDLLFFLLTICREFSIEPSEVNLKISGFILSDSTLFASLKEQFPKMIFWSPELSVHTESHFPQHFFSPILNLSACVS